jgi:hypothetical protein
MRDKAASGRAGSINARSMAEISACSRAISVLDLAIVWRACRASSRECASARRSFLASDRGQFSFGLVPPEHEVDVVLDAARVLARGAVIDQHQPVGGQLDHVAVVADQDDRAFELVERLHQRLARVDVEVVGRLVEDQQVRRVAGDQRQRQPRALAARELPTRVVARLPEKPNRPSWALTAPGVEPFMARVMCSSGVSSEASSSTWYWVK